MGWLKNEIEANRKEVASWPAWKRALCENPTREGVNIYMEEQLEAKMSLSILEVLMNAQVNFENLARMNPSVKRHPMFVIAMEQLSNGVSALEAGQASDSDYQAAE